MNSVDGHACLINTLAASLSRAETKMDCHHLKAPSVDVSGIFERKKNGSSVYH